MLAMQQKKTGKKWEIREKKLYLQTINLLTYLNEHHETSLDFTIAG